MVLGFKKEFKQPILDEIKIHSFREDPNGRWKAGNSIQMATGVRTKHYSCFKEAVCTSTQTIKLVNNPSSMLAIVDEVFIFHFNAMNIIAVNDGFENAYSMMDFFFGDQSKNFGEVTRKIIHWTDFTYSYSSIENLLNKQQ
ncbi:hypothetical protein [Roseivirga sp. UBA838]|uniref:hypothetical protein n=1 Tax=Roseivirga sp. UBA838 TaxID=1947393 RepID=UPI0025794BAC|nr:hypothetical protein [Roseivirga sp. UBA838]|tara:strand:+ start:88 stop:510 length:423 start_codon:yes stop_codon:yes gene_type:complete